MAFDNLYEIRVEQLVRDQQVVNVFHLEAESGPIEASDIVTTFLTDLLGLWQACVHTSLAFTRLFVYRLADPEDFQEYYFSDTIGQRSGGEAYAPFCAVGVRFPRLRLDMRHGYKRFAGLSEADVTGGEISVALLTLFNTFTAAIVAPWEYGESLPLGRFVIVKRVKILEIDPPGVSYRMPEDDLEFVRYAPAQRVVTRALTTQNSRKVGRGA